MKSFRRRVILWTSVIAGVVMLGFTLGSLFAYERLKLSQIDATIELVATRPVPLRIYGPHWVMLRRDFSEQVGRQFGAEGILGVYGSDVESVSDRESLSDLESIFGARTNWPEVQGEPAVGREDFERMRPGERLRLGRGRGPDRMPRSFLILDVEGVGGDTRWRVGVAKHEGFNVIFAIRRDGGKGDTAAFRNALLIVFPVSILVLSVCIWFYVTKAISPLNQLGRRMENLSALDLRKRVDVDGEYSEFTLLIERFNSLRERLDKSFEQATRFSADAAHELKTPLTVIQGQIEAALQKANEGSKEQVALARVLEEVFRLKSITRKLLILAQVDAGKLETKREVADIGKLVDESLSAISDTDPTFRFKVTKDEVAQVDCDVSLTQQILINLLGNACKYRWPLESEVEVAVRSCGDRGIVEVVNRCQPIEDGRRAFLFDRFARMDLARNRETEGVGLGLSIAREFAKAQGGSLELFDLGREDRIGFRLSLSLA